MVDFSNLHILNTLLNPLRRRVAVDYVKEILGIIFNLTEAYQLLIC